MKKNISLLIIIFTMVSCAHDSLNMDAESGNLRVGALSVQKYDIGVRSPLWHTTFPANSEIGISLFGNQSGKALYFNTKWTGSGTNWTPQAPVTLSSETATAYAYYPYSKDVVDIESIAVKYNQADYMYGRSDQTDISSATGKNTATFVMRHVMTRMAVRVRKESTYKGAGQLTKIVLRNAPRKQVLPTDPSLIRFNAKTGEIKQSGLPEAGSNLELTTDEGLLISYPVTLTTTTETDPTGSAIMAPFLFADGDVELYMVVDGEEYIVSIPSTDKLPIEGANGGWNANYNYRYILTLTPKHMTVSSVTVNDWVEIVDEPIEIK